MPGLAPQSPGDHRTEQLMARFQVSPAAPLASASPLSQPQAAAGGEGSVLRLIVLAVPGGFLTPRRTEGGGGWKSRLFCVTTELLPLSMPWFPHWNGAISVHDDKPVIN